MKKLGFTVLCVVLIIALLAPNVFAAIPAPEVPLADAATVERVKREIAAGEITNVKDVFLVACQHLGADISEDGMTAYINEDGTLGITQIFEKNDSDASVYSLNSGAEEKTIAVSTLALIDDGAMVTQNIYNPAPDQRSKIIDGTDLYIMHTAYYDGQVIGDPNAVDSIWQIRLRYIISSVSHPGVTNQVTKLVQWYEHRKDFETTESDIKTTTGIISGSYTFTPGIRSWHNTCLFETVSIVTSSTFYVTGIEDPVCLEIAIQLHDQIP